MPRATIYVANFSIKFTYQRKSFTLISRQEWTIQIHSWHVLRSHGNGWGDSNTCKGRNINQEIVISVFVYYLQQDV